MLYAPLKQDGEWVNAQHDSLWPSMTSAWLHASSASSLWCIYIPVNSRTWTHAGQNVLKKKKNRDGQPVRNRWWVREDRQTVSPSSTIFLVSQWLNKSAISWSAWKEEVHLHLFRKCMALCSDAAFPIDNSYDLTMGLNYCSNPQPSISYQSFFTCLWAFLTTSTMKALKKQIGHIWSHFTSRDSSLASTECFEMLNMQTSTISSDSKIQSNDTGSFTLETQHIDSDVGEVLVSGPVSLNPRSDDLSIPNLQMNTQDITNIMQHVNLALMEKFGWFRVLIISRMNAGKTTVLQWICNSTEDPEIYNNKGEKVWFTKLGYTRY